MILRRKVFRLKEEKSDVMRYPPLLEALFSAALAVEYALLRLGIRYPLGGSVLAVGWKHA